MGVGDLELTQNTLGKLSRDFWRPVAVKLFSEPKLAKKHVFGFRKTAPRSQKRAPTGKIVFFRRGRTPGVDRPVGQAKTLGLVIKKILRTFSVHEKIILSYYYVCIN